MPDSIRVRYVDDEPDLPALVADNLERRDHRLTVETATSVADGLEALEDVDCLLSDYRLGDGTGFDLLEGAHEKHPDLPVIFFTETGSERVASRAIGAGVTDYVLKDVVAEQYDLLANKIVAAVEQRRALDRAAELERHLHELTDQADDVMYVFSGDLSEVLFMNDAYESVFQQPVERVEEDPTAFLEAIHPEDRERVSMAMQRVMEGQLVWIDYRIDTAGPEATWVSTRAKPIIDGGAVDRIVGYTRDITDRKAYAWELERANEQLAQFAGVLAHDLRNPIAVADGYVDLLRERSDAQELEYVADALGRMDRMVTNLLDLARAGATIEEPEPVALGELSDRCWKTVAHGEATLEVATTGTIQGDWSRLRNVFENLFRNAIEHGGADVTVTVGELEDHDGFYVEDDGPGIPPDERAAVFDRGHTSAASGTGFGLAIVGEVLEAHGWEVDVTEGSAGGARFEITGVEVA